MCAVSMMHDSFRDNFPTPQQWTPPFFYEFQAIIARLAALEAAMGVKDCHDPAKTAWAKEMEERMAALEAKQTMDLRGAG